MKKTAKKQNKTKCNKKCGPSTNEVIQHLMSLVNGDQLRNMEYVSQHGMDSFWAKELKLNCEAQSFLTFLATLEEK